MMAANVLQSVFDAVSKGPPNRTTGELVHHVAERDGTTSSLAVIQALELLCSSGDIVKQESFGRTRWCHAGPR